VKSSFLTIISHLGPTHLQRVSASLGESLWQTGPPYLPILTYSLQPLKHLGLDPQKVTEIALKLHAHSVQYAYKFVSTRRALEKTFAVNHHQDQE